MRLHVIAAGVSLALSCFLSSLTQAADHPGSWRHHVGAAHGFRGSVGECVRTRVDTIGQAAAGGSSPVIHYRDGVIQEYDGGMLGQTETRPGDPIQLCLVSFTRDCGENDLPGRTYAVGNLRTGAAWTSPDVRSSCAAR